MKAEDSYLVGASPTVVHGAGGAATNMEVLDGGGGGCTG